MGTRSQMFTVCIEHILAVDLYVFFLCMCFSVWTVNPVYQVSLLIEHLFARNAWNKLGAMPTEEAMEEYITIVDEIFPNWADGSKKKDGETTMSASGSKGPMGPVFSSLMYEEDQGNESELGDIHVSAREGAIDDVKKHLAAGVQINIRDSEERTPLHWAVDRGHLDAVEVLVSSNADVNAQDNEGQTALHYAVLCEREDIAELLVKYHADLQIKDGDGNTAQDLCSSSWPFMKPAN
uniref:Predicted protein n=1 Tax=Hordeum vulgare subsp. vulgare TaxID=112509 RepID=F2DIU5_HORVV|nr:predicted protein [Hordeum vulgare subsp. vulgare]